MMPTPADISSLASMAGSSLERAETESKNEVDTDAGTDDVSAREKESSVEAWCTLTGSSLVYFSAFGVLNSFGFFQEYYRSTYLPLTPDSTIAFIGTIQLTIMNLLAAPAGSLFDCYGLKVYLPLSLEWRRHLFMTSQPLISIAPVHILGPW
jgi:hypothetical protein